MISPNKNSLVAFGGLLLLVGVTALLAVEPAAAGVEADRSARSASASDQDRGDQHPHVVLGTNEADYKFTLDRRYRAIHRSLPRAS